MAGKSPKTIATINFKGGVGKTTVTWCLGDVVSSLSNAKVLMFDLDAQMSLTQAIALNEDTGALEERFGKWYQRSVERKKTISMRWMCSLAQQERLISVRATI